MLLTPAHASLLLLAVSTLVLLICPRPVRAWTCESSCAGISLSYPFGSGWNCGSPSFQPYANCTDSKLLFYTPTGTYYVQSIDYINNVMIVLDPHMSTCSQFQASSSFGLPIGAPFSIASYNTIALIGCSSTSTLYSKQTCDASQYQVCNSLYECQEIKELGIQPDSPSTSCCVLSKSAQTTPPYEIDLPLLQCATYSSVYQIQNIQTPQSSWLYGIALSFNPGASPSAPPNNESTPYCYTCQEAEEAKASMSSTAPWLTAGMLLFLKALRLW